MGQLGARRRVPEMMDQTDIDRRLHRHALTALGRINYVSFTAARLWRLIRAGARGRRRLRLLDLACGGGDVVLSLWRRALAAGVELQPLGLDASVTAIARARAHARSLGIPARFECHDVLRGRQLPRGYDVVMSSLFLHHLEESDAIRLLGRMAAVAEQLVLVDDLVRSWPGLMAAEIGGRLLTRSPVVHVDAPRSVRAAFTPAELGQLADTVFPRGFRVRTRFPFRMTLVAPLR